MNIWLLHNSEILPIDGENVRKQRVGIIADLLCENDHTVTWWTSTFDHLSKKQRFDRDTTVIQSNAYKIELIKTPGYRKNISLQRIIDHNVLARKFIRRAVSYPVKPDIIFCALPTIDLSKAAVTYGKLFDIPVIIDARDYWPDVFLAFFPVKLRRIGRILLWKLFSDTKYVFKNTTAIFGHAPKFLEWGLRNGSRTKSEYDNHYPFAYNIVNSSEDEISEAEKFWDSLNIKGDDEYFNLVFLGTIGYLFDFETIVEAYRKLNLNGHKVRIIFGGKGDKVDYLKNLCKKYPEIYLPGWLSAAQIHVLLRRSHLGLYPVVETDKGRLFGSFDTIPNKVPEYLSSSLPIASALTHGYLYDFIENNQIGFNYSSNPQKLCDNIVYLISDHSIYKKMKENSNSVFKENFEVQKVYGKLIENIELVKADYEKIKHGRS